MCEVTKKVCRGGEASTLCKVTKRAVQVQKVALCVR